MGTLKHTLLFSCLFISAVLAKPKDYTGYRVVEVVPETITQLSLLHTLYDEPQVSLWIEPSYLGDKVAFSVSPEDYNRITLKLQQLGLKHVITVHNLQEHIALEKKLNDVNKEVGFDPKKYNRYDDIQRYLESLAAKYDFCDTVNIGKSLEGREMKMMKIGRPNATRSVVLDGGIHAREWISPAVAIYLINKLVEIFNDRSNQWELKDKITWYILPVLNPDGYEYSHEEERLWRKTRSSNGLCKGVDANRNFDFHWMEGGASDNPCSSIYAGPRPFSEIEAVNFKKFIEQTPGIDVYIPLHAYGQLWLIPWGYTRDLPADYNDLKAAADAGAAAIEKTSGKFYKVGQTTRTLYVASGGADDWAKGKAGVKYSYTIELRDRGEYGFMLPPTEIELTGQEIWAGLEAMLNQIYKK